jgi:hypothetical protein
LRWWWKDSSTNGDAFIVGTAAGVVAFGITVAVVAVLHAFGRTGQVAGWMLAVGCVASALLGGGVAWAFVARIMRLTTRALEAELSLAKTELAIAAPEQEDLRRFGIYSDHLALLIDSLFKGKLTFTDLLAEQVVLSLELTENRLRSGMTNDELCLSIWREPPVPEGVREQLKEQVRQHVPGMAERLGSSFEIVAAPTLSGTQARALEVHVEPSWLRHKRMQEIDNRRPTVYGADHLDYPDPSGPDIEAFKGLGYGSVRAVSFVRDDITHYVVLLAKEPQAFSQLEERFLLWFRRLLVIEYAVRAARAA